MSDTAARTLPGNLPRFLRAVQGEPHAQEALALLLSAKSIHTPRQVAEAIRIPEAQLRNLAEKAIERLRSDIKFHQRFHHLRAQLPDLAL